MTQNNTPSLTPAEFRAIRTELCLSQSELQEYLGVKNYRTLQRWENGDNYISPTAAHQLTELLKSLSVEINIKLIDLLKKYATATDDFVLILYAKQYAHNAAVAKAYCQFLLQGKPAHLVTFDKTDYNLFKEQTNSIDSEDNRALWAYDYWLNKRYLPHQ